jgi:Bacterial transglutaminase-like cysteine proteinase BTLCP
MKVWLGLGNLIEQQTLQSGHSIRLLQMTNADNPAILARSSGDCKHYAVLKYAMLRELGVSPDALKILVVEVRSIHQRHAILAVRAENGRWLLLDNRTMMLVESSMALDYYDPLYELDENGVRQFGLPSRSPELAQSLPDKVVFDHCCLFRHRHRDRMASKQTKILNNNQLRQLLPTQAA